jgi:hypothetical protein
LNPELPLSDSIDSATAAWVTPPYDKATLLRSLKAQTLPAEVGLSGADLLLCIETVERLMQS